jgi:predicted secreted protein
MKRVSALVIGLILVIGIVVGGVACGKSGNKSTEVPKQVSVEVSNDEFQAASASNGGVVNKTIEVASGDSIVVTLWSNKTTGYSWSESATISNPGVLQQTNHEYVAPETGLMGAAGKEVWTFKASKAGTCEVSMNYSQPWEGGQKNTYRFLLTVTVN